jgi:hypothetical protein
MKVKSILLGFFVVAAFTVVVSVGVSQAELAFADWAGTWFEVSVSETGKAGPAVSLFPLGDEIYTNNEKTSTTYLLVDGYDFDTATFDVVYCTFDGSIWARHTGLEWNALSGEPKNFLAFFSVSYEDAQGSEQAYWIPLNVKGKESSSNAGEVKSGSFKNLGGVFTEVRADKTGMGEVKFKGTFVDPDDVLTVVPEGCRIPL